MHAGTHKTAVALKSNTYACTVRKQTDLVTFAVVRQFRHQRLSCADQTTSSHAQKLCNLSFPTDSNDPATPLLCHITQHDSVSPSNHDVIKC